MTPAEIARSLTEAQRRAIASGVGPDGRGKWPLRNALHAKGLATSFPWRLSPLGEAVRQCLMQEERS